MSNELLENYNDLPQFKDIYLEDSFVLGISTEKERIEFRLEIVLAKNHPLYKKPLENEFYCYRNANLVFADFDEVKWLEKKTDYFTDASGETDYGNIDFFKIEDDFYDLGGDWGRLIIKGGMVKLEF